MILSKEQYNRLPEHLKQYFGSKNEHPCLKPINLTTYLCKLLLPPAMYAPRHLLVPFAGAASEMIGAYQAGWEDITGIEMTPEYVQIAEARLKYWTRSTKQLDFLKDT